MIVCIAEKPSVGMDIAKVLGATTKKDGYFEGNGYQVTWTYGHLCCLKEPNDYDDKWKRWSLDVLPMVPPRFGIKLIEDTGVKKQFSIVKKLFFSADEIINCGDAGQEGELIQRWVMQYAGVRCPVKRLWISSLTEEAIRDGFRKLADQSKYDNLYMAGLSRACGDWLLGMNATRLYTLKYGGGQQVLSIGRVQTPTLALIVQRHKEISEFHPEPYWVLQTIYRSILFTSAHGKFMDSRVGEECYRSIQDLPFVVTSVAKNQGTEAPKQLYDLTTLQVECNKAHGFSADLTLKVIQSLYEKKVTTYPRVDTRYLSEDIYPKCERILNCVMNHSFDAVTCQALKKLLTTPLLKRKKVFDTAKVTDHHAIIPTGVTPSTLSKEETVVYDMVTRRFVSVFLPDCKFYTTTVMGKVGDQVFKTSGKEISQPGWKMLERADKGQEQTMEKPEETILPVFQIGESGPHKPSLKSKQTVPPKPYTEATLLQAMETAGKFVADEELKQVMKENGIGRPSSRAAIIETLFKRRYVIRNKTALIPTRTGIELIATIKTEMLKSCELTGQWEKKLREMERGKYQAATFMRELNDQMVKMVEAVRSDNSSHVVYSSISSTGKQSSRPSSHPHPMRKGNETKVTKVTIGQKCPLCQKGIVIKTKDGFMCSRRNAGCTYKT